MSSPNQPRDPSAPTRVLFVCYANVTRSPLAEGVLRHLVQERGLADRFVVASAGISAFEGSPPDPGSVAIAARNGIALAGRSRQMSRQDLFDNHHVLVADRQVAERIRRLMGASAFGELGVPARVRMLARLADPQATDVPDPIGGGPAGYADLYALVHRACTVLLDELAR
ncbi:MAG: low molecular weight phosphotyrosine protein phosphatase [Myxococcales bacterium]|nr:low molecular weight phosphotyrosine protein phosphatase [Myxococcales bacterium]